MADYSNDFDEINKLAKEAIEKLESSKGKNPAKAAVPESKPTPKAAKVGKKSKKVTPKAEVSPDQAVMDEAKKLEPKKKEPSAKVASKPQTAKPEVSKKAVKSVPEAVPSEAPPGQVAKRLKEQPVSAKDPMDAARSKAKTGSLKGRVKDQLVDPMDMVRTKGMMADSMPIKPPARPPAAKIGSEVVEEAVEQAPMPQIPKSGWGERIAGEGVEELAESAPRRAAKTLEEIVPTKSAMQRFGERSARALAEGSEKIGKRMIGAPLVAAGVLAGPVGFALNALMESLDAENANPPEHDAAAIAASQKEADALRKLKDAKQMNRTPQQTIEDDYAEMLRQNPDQ